MGIITIKNIVLLKERLNTNMKNILKTLILLTAFFMNYANAVTFYTPSFATAQRPVTMYVVNKSQDSISYDFQQFIQGFNTLDSINGNPVGRLGPGAKAVFNLSHAIQDVPFQPAYGWYNGTFSIDNTDLINRSPFINGMVIPIELWHDGLAHPPLQYINFRASDGWIIKSDTERHNTITNNNGLNIGLDAGGVDMPSLRDIYFYVYPM